MDFNSNNIMNDTFRNESTVTKAVKFLESRGYEIADKKFIVEGWGSIGQSWQTREEVINDYFNDGFSGYRLVKIVGNWGCFIDNKDYPFAICLLLRREGNEWMEKAVDTGEGPTQTNTTVARWLKKQLEEYEKTHERKKDYSWDWINRCLGDEEERKEKESIINSLVEGDKIKLKDSVENGAIVTYAGVSSKKGCILVYYKGNLMICRKSFVEKKVEG